MASGVRGASGACGLHLLVELGDGVAVAGRGLEVADHDQALGGFAEGLDALRGEPVPVTPRRPV